MEQTIGQPVGRTGILRTLNIKKMIKRLLLTSTLLASSALAIQAQDLFLSEGQYYTDESQTTPYTGRYTEFYDDGMLKMELFLKDGRPEGTYVIYYPDGKIAEVRSYYHGIFHGAKFKFTIIHDFVPKGFTDFSTSIFRITSRGSIQLYQSGLCIRFIVQEVVGFCFNQYHF